MKPEATAVGLVARWPLKNNLNFDGRRVSVLYVTADNTSLVISDVLRRRNQSQ